MKAIRVHEFGDPEVMSLEEVPDLQPGPGQVVVTVKAAGVNPVDTYIRSGQYAKRPALPYTPGMDSGGVVASVGEGVSGVAVGDRVYTAGTVTGAYAEQVLCNGSQVHPLPEHVSYQQGAAMGVPGAGTRIVPCSIARLPRPERLSWCTVPPAGSGLRRCNWLVLRDCE